MHCVTAGEFPRVPDYAAPGERRVGVPGSGLTAVRDRGAAHARSSGSSRRRSREGAAPEPADVRLSCWALSLTTWRLSSGARLRLRSGPTGSGLRLDQAAVAYNMLTSRGRAEIGVASRAAARRYMAGQGCRGVGRRPGRAA